MPVCRKEFIRDLKSLENIPIRKFRQPNHAHPARIEIDVDGKDDRRSRVRLLFDPGSHPTVIHQDRCSQLSSGGVRCADNNLAARLFNLIRLSPGGSQWHRHQEAVQVFFFVLLFLRVPDCRRRTFPFLPSSLRSPTRASGPRAQPSA